MNITELQALDAQNVMQTYGRLPVAFVRGEGTKLWDSEGNEYLDFLSGLAVTSLGHAHPEVAEAVADQARTLLHVSNLYYNDVQPKVAVTQPPTPTVTASAADARAVASEFLTWCNHRQWRDVDRLSALDGSSELRSQLIDLIRKAPDFQAGFERLASQPTVSDGTFTTDFVLDLEWRGGQRQLAVVVRAQLSNGAWHLAGFGIHTPD